jgi:hypothetical protein
LLIPKLYNGRNRSFWFVGYEGSRWVRNNPQLGSAPTTRMRGGDFGELSTPIHDPASNSNATLRDPFPRNVIPASRFNSLGKNILDRFPLPDRPALVGNVQGVFRVLTPVGNYNGRFDHAFSDRQRAFCRYTRVESVSDQGWPLGDNDARTAVVNFPSRNWAVSYVNTISAALHYTGTFGYTQFGRFLLDRSNNQDGAAFFGYTVSPLNSAAYSNVRPQATFDIYDALGANAANIRLREPYS